MEVLVENLNEVVDSFKVEEIIIANINTDAEVEASIASVDNLEVAELNKVGVFGISNRHNYKTKNINISRINHFKTNLREPPQ